MKKVLIISYPEDGTVKLLADRFDEMEYPYHIIDLSLFPGESQGSIDLTSGLDFVFQQGNKSFDAVNVKGIWWRRPLGKIRVEPTDSLYKYVKMESDMFVRSLFYLLPKDVVWVSDPDSTRIANSKPS
jgi:hypothetical protein